jgi:hypothetical protein
VLLRGAVRAQTLLSWFARVRFLAGAGAAQVARAVHTPCSGVSTPGEGRPTKGVGMPEAARQALPVEMSEEMTSQTAVSAPRALEALQGKPAATWR